MQAKTANIYDLETLEHMSKSELVATVLKLQQRIKSKPAGRKNINIPADVIDHIIELRKKNCSFRSISDIIANENGLKLSYEKVRGICKDKYEQISSTQISEIGYNKESFQNGNT